MNDTNQQQTIIYSKALVDENIIISIEISDELNNYLRDQLCSLILLRHNIISFQSSFPQT